jgi:uncharacterized protein YegL
MQTASASYAPVFFLMTEGDPNDDYRTHLAKLQKNGWFKASTKVALAIGDDANDQVLMEFTGSKEAVVRVSDGANAGEKLAKMVQFIAITSSQVASTPAEAGDKTKQEQLEEVISNAKNGEDEFDLGGTSGDDDDIWSV